MIIVLLPEAIILHGADLSPWSRSRLARENAASARARKFCPSGWRSHPGRPL